MKNKSLMNISNTSEIDIFIHLHHVEQMPKTKLEPINRNR